jgi:hypothetical protein
MRRSMPPTGNAAALGAANAAVGSAEDLPAGLLLDASVSHCRAAATDLTSVTVTVCHGARQQADSEI